MHYRINPKNGDRLSQLGLGCMRLPRSGSQVNQAKTDELVERAIGLGVNYFDTAYIYRGSEEALGSALRTLNKRDEVRLATKLPHYMCNSGADFDRLFEKQLERLKTDRVDYYLIHMLGDAESFDRLRSMGIEDWLSAQKRNGRVINTGFSFHGGRAQFKSLIDAYDWDFCMVQYNYFDENNQAGKAGVHYAAGKGLPVFVMEPLRGGMLVNGLPRSVRELFAGNGGRSAAEWGLSWLYDQPEVTVVLSGMGNITELEENAAIAGRLMPSHVTPEQAQVYSEAVRLLNAAVRVPCTGCNYCMPCPHGVDIPTCFAAYNESYVRSRASGQRQYFMTTGALSGKQSNASKCKNCGKCEKHCPQSIKISERLREVTHRLEGLWFRPVTAVARKLMLRTRR